MATPKVFAGRIRKISGYVVANSPILVKKAAFAIDAQVVVATPVDTGRARSNWVVGLNGPVTEEVTNFPKGKNKSTKQAATQKAINDGSFRILQHLEGQSIYISNNLNYIMKLNQGTSDQAGKNFVEKSIAAGVAAIRGVKLLKNNGIGIF